MDDVKEKTIILSSKYKSYRKDTPCKFTVHLDNSVDVSDVNRIVVKSVHFPNLFGNIGSWNNTLHFVVGTTAYTVTVPPGQYSVATFLVALQASIDATGATTVTAISHDEGTYRITIDTADPISFLSDKSIITKSGFHSSLNNVVGADSFDNTPFTTSTIFPGVLNLSGPTQIHLASRVLGSSHSYDSRGDSRSVLCVVPVDVPYGSTVHWYAQSHLLSFVDLDDVNLSTIDIVLTTPDGQTLELPVNALTEVEIMCVFTN
jgi:hypothetical protein